MTPPDQLYYGNGRYEKTSEVSTVTEDGFFLRIEDGKAIIETKDGVYEKVETVQSPHHIDWENLK